MEHGTRSRGSWILQQQQRQQQPQQNGNSILMNIEFVVCHGQRSVLNSSTNLLASPKMFGHKFPFGFASFPY